MAQLPRSQRDLEIIISSTPEFPKPHIALEQYMTPPRIVAAITIWAFHWGDLYEMDVYDLCAGTGIFSRAALHLGARRVVSIEIDREALLTGREKIAKEEFANWFPVVADVLRFQGKKADTVLMNPPFGIQSKYRDVEFLKSALRLGKIVYSLHWYSEKNEHYLRNWVEKQGAVVTDSVVFEYELPRRISFHKKNKKITQLVVLRIKT